MAVNLRQRFTVHQAKLQRMRLPRYIALDGARYLVMSVLLLMLMSLLMLAQTGHVQGKGYDLAQLEEQRLMLQHERSDLQLRLSEAQSLKRIQTQARELGLRPATADQTRYLTAGPEDREPAPDDAQPSPASGNGD